VPGFDVVRRTPLDAAEAWRRVTDWERHGEFVPLTRMNVLRDPATGQVSFVARTAVGPLGFDDVMAVTYSRPPSATEPGVVRIVKQGRVVLGWAVLTVTPVDSGSEVRWHEEARLRWTRGPVVTLVDRAVARGFGRLLDGLLAE
jgi:hypothetical protein